MKFGSHLKEAISPEWQSYYLDYDLLKQKLLKAEKEEPFTDRDETEFVEMLDNDLEKVYAFHKAKMTEIHQEIDFCATTIATPTQDTDQLQEKINHVADDITRLEKFTRFNYTGFLKIVKKHDRHTDYILRPMFMVRLNQCPFWKENEDTDALLIKLSELFTQVRGGGKTMSFKQPSTMKETPALVDFESRRTIVKRFFVHTDDILELKTSVLRHLPVLVYRAQQQQQDVDIDPPISTLYLDNTDLETYGSRVESTSKSQIIRLRWYGSAQDNRNISVERRTLEDEHRGELKDKFIIKDKYVDGFLRGETIFLEKSVEKMVASGKTQQEIERYTKLVQGVQQQVMNKHMEPILSTYYKRTAFQIPGDSSVRMALDTDLCFIREDSGLFPNDPVQRRPHHHWHRPDADINFPFGNLTEDIEVNRYPYATFEIKLDLAPNEVEPKWVLDLEESGLLEEAYQFSKFVHGIAIMFDTRVPLLPYWLAQVDDDRKLMPMLPSQAPLTINKKLPTSGSSKQKVVTSNERTSLLQGGTPSYTSVNQSTSAAAVEVLPPPSSVWQKLAYSLYLTPRPEQHQDEYIVTLPPGVKIPNKVIAPIRVEPKVFFANERTYFSWMKFGTMLATFSLALFNSGDAVGKISGVVYTLVALSTLIYGVGLYYRRRELIRARLPGPYDELIGPTVICFALMFAVGMNAYLKFTATTPQLLYLF